MLDQRVAVDVLGERPGVQRVHHLADADRRQRRALDDRAQHRDVLLFEVGHGLLLNEVQLLGGHAVKDHAQQAVAQPELRGERVVQQAQPPAVLHHREHLGVEHLRHKRGGKPERVAHPQAAAAFQQQHVLALTSLLGGLLDVFLHAARVVRAEAARQQGRRHHHRGQLARVGVERQHVLHERRILVHHLTGHRGRFVADGLQVADFVPFSLKALAQAQDDGGFAGVIFD